MLNMKKSNPIAMPIYAGDFQHLNLSKTIDYNSVFFDIHGQVIATTPSHNVVMTDYEQFFGLSFHINGSKYDMYTVGKWQDMGDICVRYIHPRNKTLTQAYSHNTTYKRYGVKCINSALMYAYRMLALRLAWDELKTLETIGIDNEAKIKQDFKQYPTGTNIGIVLGYFTTTYDMSFMWLTNLFKASYDCDGASPARDIY
jgi:hypothetical protein